MTQTAFLVAECDRHRAIIADLRAHIRDADVAFRASSRMCYLSAESWRGKLRDALIEKTALRAALWRIRLHDRHLPAVLTLPDGRIETYWPDSL